MTREEIENGENVWYIDNNMVCCIENKFIQRIYKGIVEYYIEDKNYYKEISLFDLYKTKAEAEHYLCHANITRTETLPFLTWEEFQKTGYFDFIGADKNNYCLDEEKMSDQIVLGKFVKNSKALYEWVKYWKGFNETNFYKAYDECVKAFKGEL